MADEQQLKYTEDHEWVRADGEVVTVGITEYAADKLGDVVFVQPPEPGRTVSVGEVIAEIESTKSVGEIFAPVAGTIADVNHQVVDAPELINSDPLGEGWLVRITPSGTLPALLDLAAYRALIGQADSEK